MYYRIEKDRIYKDCVTTIDIAHLYQLKTTNAVIEYPNDAPKPIVFIVKSSVFANLSSKSGSINPIQLWYRSTSHILG